MKFLNNYNSIRKTFENDNQFKLIKGDKNKIKWPKSSGVYIIWKKNSTDINNLIYIGMTGKFVRINNEIVEFNKALFKSRKHRWTPYRFCESDKDGENKFIFRYGPIKSSASEQEKIKYQPKAYKHSVKYEEIEIHCFQINSDHPSYSPILLESEFLTNFLKETGSLPPGNNSL